MMCFDGTMKLWVKGKGIQERFQRGNWVGQKEEVDLGLR
jgi:hypothetical protein